MKIIDVEGLSKSFRVAQRRVGVVGALRSVIDPQIRIVDAGRTW